jgi:antirestriction protein ArdC
METRQHTTPYEVITNRILALLEQGAVPWRQPWDSVTGMPRNLFSQRSYRGINVWLLTAMEYASPFWATFHQVKAARGSVRKGARGVPVVFWKVYDHEDSETGEAEKRFVLRQYTVFNAAQLDGVAIPEMTILAHRFTPIERCAQLLDAMPQRPAILHGHQRACYTPATDTQHLPSPACFQSPEAYYATVWHELVHSTGHRSRLNRATLTDLCLFGDPTYAKEELVAEMGASYLCGVCGIANATLANSAAYLQSWMQVLRHDPTMLVHAAAQAQRAADYIQNLHSATGASEERSSIPIRWQHKERTCSDTHGKGPLHANPQPSTRERGS